MNEKEEDELIIPWAGTAREHFFEAVMNGFEEAINSGALDLATVYHDLAMDLYQREKKQSFLKGWHAAQESVVKDLSIEKLSKIYKHTDLNLDEDTKEFLHTYEQAVLNGEIDPNHETFRCVTCGTECDFTILTFRIDGRPECVHCMVNSESPEPPGEHSDSPTEHPRPSMLDPGGADPPMYKKEEK